MSADWSADSVQTNVIGDGSSISAPLDCRVSLRTVRAGAAWRLYGLPKFDQWLTLRGKGATLGRTSLDRSVGWRMAELAILRIHWPAHWSMRGSGARMVIEVDGREVGRVRNGQNLVTHVESGRRNLRARMWPNKFGAYRSMLLELTLAPGEDVRLEPRISKSAWASEVSLARIDGGVTVPPTQSAAPLAAQVLDVTEIHRSEEPIGTETRRIDNTAGASRLTRTMRVTREWSRTVSLDLNASHGTSVGEQIGPNWLELRTNVEQTLSRTYTASAGRREEFAEEIGVEVEPGTALTIVLAWKQLWQHGRVRVLSQGRQVDVPFRVAVGITFDQSTK